MRGAMSFSRRTGLLLWLWLPLACSLQRGDGPGDAYRAFARAARKGDLTKAWGGLSARTREELERRARALEKASGGAVKDDPAALFFYPGAQRDEKITGVEVLSLGSGTAVIRVTTGQRSRELKMVKEQAAWRLDLADTL